MFCSVFEQVHLSAGQLVCDLGMSTAGTGLVLAVALVSIAVMALRFKRGHCRIVGSGLLMVLSACAFALSLERPAWVSAADASRDPGGLVVAVVDMSDSVWRDEDKAQAALGRLAEQADRLVQSLDDAGDWDAVVLGFSDGVRATGPEQPLPRLPAMLRATQPNTRGDASRGNQALDAALDRIRAHGGRGAILLLSDGRFDSEIQQALLDQAITDGVAISVLGVGARAPAKGLVAADLGPEQEVGRDVTIRATVLGDGTLSAEAGTANAEVAIDDGGVLQPVRLTTRFGSRGVQHVRLRHTAAGKSQDRILYTLVNGPARILAFGDAPWLKGLEPSRWTVARADPAAPPPPEGFDVVVVDSLSPDAFPPDYPAALLAAAPRTGFFLVNGGLRVSDESPQVIGDWNDSVLSPILPVDSDPRLFIEQPPGRDIVILFDTSGSMGASLGLGKAVAHTILDQLRPQDTVAILPFSDRPGRSFRRKPATAQNVGAARGFVNNLVADGGTAPDSTLRKAAQLRTNYCAFFFISDGGFQLPPTSPQCFTTAVSTEGSAFPSGVAAWGQEIRLHGSVSGVSLNYFEPEERETYFRPGVILPMPAEGPAPLTGQPVPGIAIAYPRIDADVASLHPDPPPDPVLVWRQDPASPGISTAVFLSAMPAAAPAADVEAVLSHLLGWNRPDRFDIRIRQAGDRLTVTVLTLETQGAPLPGSLSGSLRISGHGMQPLAFRQAGAPGRFEVSVTPQLGEAPATGELILSEPGAAPQVIPVSLPPRPPAGASAGLGEAFDFGVNATALRQIAEATGGVDLGQGLPAFHGAALPQRRLPLHPWTICIALFFLAGALWFQGRPN